MSQTEINAYIAQLSPQEQKVLKIAKDHLESSFNLVKSIGFQEWQAKQAQAKQAQTEGVQAKHTEGVKTEGVQAKQAPNEISCETVSSLGKVSMQPLILSKL